MAALNEEIVNEVKKRSAGIDIPGIRMVAISLGYTLVELENDIIGICFTPRSESSSCAHYFKAGTLAQHTLLELAELMLSANPLEKSVGIAAVNAASRLIMDLNPNRYRFADKDFLDLIPFGTTPPKVGMVGNIAPFIPFLVKNASSLTVIDDNPELMTGIMQSGYTISREIADLSDCEVVLITGSAAAVGDFDSVLAAAVSARFIGVVGPSAGWLPDPLFRKGVNAVAATKIINFAEARQAILEGGGTPHFIRYGEKYTIVNPSFSS